MSCFLGLISKVRKQEEKKGQLWEKVFHGVSETIRNYPNKSV